jgi:hypothetical protein
MAKRKWRGRFMRHPRTQQERCANQERNDPLVRRSRKNLPTSYDDFWVRSQKSWKWFGRKQQYREEENYGWYKFDYTFNSESRMVARNIMNQLEKLGCFYRHTRGGIKWFGPADPT